MLAKMTCKNQITLPKAVVKQLAGAAYFDVSVKDGVVILKPVVVTVLSQRAQAARAKMQALGLSEKNVANAIHWARARGNR